MRYEALFLMAWTLLAASLPLAASPVISSNLAVPGPRTVIRQAPVTDMEYGVRAETPNQRRLRLGEPITASFPAPDYGVKSETPNQRRQRLGQPLPIYSKFEN